MLVAFGTLLGALGAAMGMLAAVRRKQRRADAFLQRGEGAKRVATKGSVYR